MKVADTLVPIDETVDKDMDPKLSVIVPLSERYDDIEDVFLDYYSGIKNCGITFEFIYVLDGPLLSVLDTLRCLKASHNELKIVVLPKSYGEATAISAGFEASRGVRILTLPPYKQVDGKNLSKILAENDSDVVVGSRSPRIDSWINRIQTMLFSKVVSSISGLSLQDSGCSVRLFKREVLEEVELYGDFHRFLPMLAHRQGFVVNECELEQSSADRGTRVYSPGLYLRRLLDILTFYFLTRFTKKPFRFFGLIGGTFAGVGFVVTTWVAAERLFAGIALADRPALLFGTLLMALGVQILSVGLVAEIIIFTHARELREYSIKQIFD